MKIFTIVFYLVVFLGVCNAYAQNEEDFGLEINEEDIKIEKQSEAMLEKNEIRKEVAESKEDIKNDEEVSEEVITEKVVDAVVEEEKNDIQIESEKGDISFYVENLDLSGEQLDKIKQISDDMRLEQERILNDMYKLYQQSKNLEDRSLKELKAVLTEEQLKKFYLLKNNFEQGENIEEQKTEISVKEDIKNDDNQE